MLFNQNIFVYGALIPWSRSPPIPVLHQGAVSGRAPWAALSGAADTLGVDVYWTRATCM
ncbi:MAG: hypothetical protein R3D59_09910 [Paracoccaceae bacterium]